MAVQGGEGIELTKVHWHSSGLGGRGHPRSSWLKGLWKLLEKDRDCTSVVHTMVTEWAWLP